MPTPSSRRRARIVLSLAGILLASPLAHAAAPDPFTPFPAAEGEASDPRIEAMRAALRPDTFKPTHEVVITDDLYFMWSGMGKYVKGCGGDPTLSTRLPKEGVAPTPFRARFENPQAPIRTYVGHGHACTFPVRFGPAKIGYDAPAVTGLITYADGSYWLGEVAGAANPESRESILYAIATPLTPTPAGLGEWGRADGTRLQGEARRLAVPKWPAKRWTSASVVAFEMASIQRTAPADGRVLADNPRPDTGAGVDAQATAAAKAPAVVAPPPVAAPAPQVPVAAIGGVQTLRDTRTVPATPVASPGNGPVTAASPMGLPGPTTAARPMAGAAPAAAAMTAPGEGAAGQLAARIDAWRAALASERFASARSSVASGALHKSREFNSYVQACGGGAPTPFRLGFANADAVMRSYTGFATGCTFPAQPSDLIFGAIEYADGSRWLGQVSAMPQAEAIELGAFGGMPSPVQTLVPAPHGAGEWKRVDGTVVQGFAAPLQPKFLFRDTWTQGPLGAFAMTEVTQLITPDNVAYIGAIRLSEQGFSAEQATVRWRDGRVFTGSVEASLPKTGTMAYPDGGRVTGTVVRREDGILAWQDGAWLDLSIETKAGPPGRYVYFAPIRFETMSQGLLEVAGARPVDAATLARAGRNTRQCPAPPVVPAGWVAWWPSCEAGQAGRVAMYSADAQQMLLYSASGDPKRYLLRKGTEPGQFRGIEIRADAFTRDALPSPVGEGELYLWGERVFVGEFTAQQPGNGRCTVPANEGGGWEPCQYVAWQRVDPAHQLRQERLALAREQQELQWQLEEEAEAEAYARQQWEAEQERAELDAQIREGQAAGQMAIINALQDAARDISQAYVEREQARYDYEVREREAARPRYTAPAPSGGYGGSGGGNNDGRAAQLAAKQAELSRKQAELQERQQALTRAARATPSPSPAASFGAGGGTASGASATESYGFVIADHAVGKVSATRQILGLAVTLEVRRVGLEISSADRSEICASFENRTQADWSGGYRLTDRSANNTHASLRVPAGGITRQCETLNPQSNYTVVLRRDPG